MTDLDQVATRRRTMHEQRVRAERAERELRRTERILARLYEMADAWDDLVKNEDDKRIRADLLADQVRRTIRETP